MGTPQQEVKTAGSGVHNIQKLLTHCKRLSDEASRAETEQAWQQTTTSNKATTMKKF